MSTSPPSEGATPPAPPSGRTPSAPSFLRVAVGNGHKMLGVEPGRAKADIPRALYPLDLWDALHFEWPFDAFATAYVVRGARRHPRINKPGLEAGLISLPVEVTAFFCDMDNPGHGPWTDDLFAQAMREYEALDILRTAGVYHTTNGRRFVQPLARPIPALDAELYLSRWLRQLEAAGLAPDENCKDWTRFFRLPHVIRDGKRFRSPYVNFANMVAIEVEPIEVAKTVVHARAAGRRNVVVRPALIEWTKDVPTVWKPRVEQMATAVREVQTEWHSLFLAIAGALLSKGVAFEHVPMLCRAISIATNADSKTADREIAARTTIDRFFKGRPLRAMPALRRDWPQVAAVFDAIFAGEREAQLHDDLRAAEAALDDAMTASDVAEAVNDILRHVPLGVTVIATDDTQAGLRAATAMASERAAKKHVSAEADPERAPRGSKTAIAVATHDQAIALATDLRKLGTPTRWAFGPLALREDDGTPVCKLYKIAKPLVAGGQVMQWELCRGRDQDPCPHFHDCRARLGEEGPEDARVVVSIHGLASRLAEEIGNTGLLVFDELPELLDGQTITLGELDTALRLADVFVGGYGAAMRPLLLATRAFTAEIGELLVSASLEAAAREAARVVPIEDLEHARRGAELESGDHIDCARAAPANEKHVWVPPIMFREIVHAKTSPAHADQLGTASKVYRLIREALRAESDAVVRAARENGQRVLRLTSLRQHIIRGMRREGPTVVLSGQSVTQLPELTKALGYEPYVRRLRVTDAAPITRSLIRTSSATRASWISHGKVRLVPSLTNTVRSCIDWALEDLDAATPRATRSLAIVTFEAIALALAAAHRPADPSLEEGWKAAKQEHSVLAEARAQLGPILARWSGGIFITTFEGTARLASIRDLDALVTLGDPWRGRAPAEDSQAFLGELPASGGARDRQVEDCRAVLERAHSWMRPAERLQAGRALHVGNVLPGGTSWTRTNVEVRQLQVGRPRRESAMDREEFAAIIEQLGGLRATARLLGRAPASLHGYKSGRFSIPIELAAQLRDHVH